MFSHIMVGANDLEASKKFLADSQGSIVCISSICGNETIPGAPVTYSVAKTGLIGLTRYLATYWSNKNIRCNAISPGGVFNGHNKNFVTKI